MNGGQENAAAQPGARRKGVNIQSAWAAAPGAAPGLAEESAKPVPVLRLGTARAEMWQATEAAATARTEAAAEARVTVTAAVDSEVYTLSRSVFTRIKQSRAPARQQGDARRALSASGTL